MTKKENLVTIVEVSTVEYENSERYFKVFDISGESAIIIPKRFVDMSSILDSLYKNKAVEIAGEINWEE